MIFKKFRTAILWLTTAKGEINYLFCSFWQAGLYPLVQTTFRMYQGLSLPLRGINYAARTTPSFSYRHCAYTAQRCMVCRIIHSRTGGTARTSPPLLPR